MKFKQTRVNDGSSHDMTLSIKPALNVKVMEIHTSLDEIIDTLKKLKDAVPADFHHQDIVKQDMSL